MLTQDVKNFFQQILPEVGVYTAVKKTTKLEHKIYYSKIEFIDLLANELTENNDWFYSMASYLEGWHKNDKGYNVFRTQNNVCAVRSLWLDIDVGDSKDYTTPQEAVEALKAFLTHLQLPIPITVASGSGGFHCYWTLTDDINVDDWKTLATALKNACKKLGFRADPSRTTDSASILRVPNTFNCKRTPFKPVKLLIPTTTPLTYQQFLEKLSTFRQVEVLPTDVVVKRNAFDVVATCPQLRQQHNATEPVWRGMLATLRACDNGVQVCHLLSKQHPNYSPQETDEKLNYLNERNIAPYTCETFHTLRPEVCQACPYHGKAKSPVGVPQNLIKTVTIDDDGNVADIERPLPKLSPSTSDVPHIKTKRFEVNDNGCFAFINVPNADGYWAKIYDYPVFPIQRVRDVHNGKLTMSYIVRKYRLGGHDDIEITGETLLGSSASSFLGSVGFLLQDKEKKLMTALLIDVLRHMEARIDEVNVANQLGWDSKHQTFLLGNKLYRRDGNVIDVTPRGKACDYSDMTVATGDLARWKQIANVYNKKGLEWGQAVVCSAFASPLMSIGALERAGLLFITGEKGAGKSTALQIATSVFGNPSRMMINKNDTALARLAKLGIFNSISASFDEMTDLSPKEASELAYQITQGRGKDRMGDMGKDLQKNTTFWSCMPVMSANDSIINSLALHSHDATAQMSRVLEVKARNINTVYNKEEVAECERLVRSVGNNYGVAGDVYIRYITANYEKVEQLILAVEKVVKNELQLDNSLRFWTYMCTRLVTGLIIANKLGLVDYDYKTFFLYLKGLINKAKATITKFEYDPDDTFNLFMAQMHSSRLDVVSAERPANLKDQPSNGANNDIGYVLACPTAGNDLVMRVEQDTDIAYIVTGAIREWCKQHQVPYDDFIESLKRKKMLLKEKTRVAIGRGTRYRNIGRPTCIKVQLQSD